MKPKKIRGPENVVVVTGSLVRVILLAVLGVAASIYAITRYYMHATHSQTRDVEPTNEIPAPDLIEDSD